MAGVNRVEFGDEVILDLSQDTVTENSLRNGFTAHNAKGEPIVGVGGSITSGIDDTADSQEDTDVLWSAGRIIKEFDDVKGTFVNRMNGNFYASIIKNEYVNNNTGAIEAATGFARTDFIPVGKIRMLQFRTTAASDRNYFYDANKNPIKKFYIINEMTKYIVPHNAAFIVLSNTLAGLQNTVGSFESLTEYRTNEIIEKTPEHYLPIKFVEGSYINNSGVETPYDGYVCSGPINCEKVHRFVFDNTQGQDSSWNAFYDANNQFISLFSLPKTKNAITIPANAAYFRLSGTRTFADGLKIVDPFWQSYGYSLDKLNWVLNNIANGFLSYPIVYNTWISNGVETPDPSSKSSGFIACSFGDIFEITTTHANNYNAYYDQNKTFVRVLRLENGKNTITIPAGVSYFRISESASIMDQITIKKLSNSSDPSNPSDILNLNPETEIKGVLSNLNWHKDAAEESYQYKPLVMLHFTDIHGSSVQLSRIMRFYNYYRDYFDDAIHTGDAVVTAFENSFDFWQTCGAGKVLNVCGNHDVWTSDPTLSGCKQWTVGYSAKQGYLRYIEPYINNWNVDGYVANKMYWYKDYPDSNVRLIALDIYHCNETVQLPDGTTSNAYPKTNDPVDNNEQLRWLRDVALAGAKTNGLSVVIAAHAPYPHTRVESNFMTLDELTDTGNYGLQYDIVSMVQTFINDGGKFVCWITGHAHQDMTCRLNNFQDQFLICLDTAMGTREDDGTSWSNNVKIPGTKSMDLFNIFSVDTNKKFIRLYRIGLDHDRHGRHIGSLVYDYENKNLIYSD